MPMTKPAEKPVMSLEQILSLLGAITDLHDLCLMYVGIFSGPRASEVMGFQWKSWTGESLMPHGTAVEGQFYKGRLKTKASRSTDSGSGAGSSGDRGLAEDLPGPVSGGADVSHLRTRRTQGRGSTASGEELPEVADSSVAREAGDSGSLVTFQVMRRSLGTHMQDHGTLKDTQACSTPRQHHDDRQCLRAGGRGERDAGGQLSRQRRYSMAGRRWWRGWV